MITCTAKANSVNAIYQANSDPRLKMFAAQIRPRAEKCRRRATNGIGNIKRRVVSLVAVRQLSGTLRAKHRRGGRTIGRLSFCVSHHRSRIDVRASLAVRRHRCRRGSSGYWFVFGRQVVCVLGCRHPTPSVRSAQIVQPRYTAETILGIKNEESHVVVRELGFANAAIAVVGIGSIIIPAWVTAGALAGGIFYGLAGVNHALRPHRNRLEVMAMISDLFVAVVLLGALAANWLVLA